MRKYNNFKEYIEDHYLDEIMDAVRPLVIRTKDSFENSEFSRVSWVELVDVSISGVTFKDLGENWIEIRVSASAEIEVRGITKYGPDSDSASRTYNVFIKAKLENGLHNVKVINAEEYNKASFDKQSSLSQHLIPYLYEENIEKCAEEFLKQIFPLALEQPVPLPVEDITKKLGMEIYYAPLGQSVFGKTYFGEDLVKVYSNGFNSEEVEIITKPGTMLINPNVYFMYNIGTANNTIIHECVHWVRHRRAFELQRLLENGSSHISCEIIESYEGIPDDSPALKWMEWQANQLAPRILMPAETTRRKFNELLNTEIKKNPRKRFAECMESAIADLSLFFQVSLVAAKLRVIELGYDQAQGVQVYCNDKRIPSFSFSKGVLKRDQTFVIDENNLLFNLFIHSEIGRLFSEGKLVYVNCMLCVNTPKFIILDEDYKLSLTPYALDHVDECCFIFTRKYSASKTYSDTFYRRCFLCRDVDSGSFIESDYDENHKSNQSKTERENEMSKISDFARDIADNFEEGLGGFAKTLNAHMLRRDVKEEELAFRTGISTTTISKYLNDSSCEKKFANVLAVGKALNLNPIYMEDLLEKAKFANINSHTQIVVRYLIWNHMDDSIEEWQEKLDQANVNLKLPHPD